MATTDNRVEVALPSDENYVCGLLVTAASMAKYMPSDVTLSISVLDGGIHDATFTSFTEKVKNIHEQTEFRRLRISEEDFSAYPEWSGNRMTYARLMLSELLPDVDHVVYCDTDFLWLCDIVELWKQRDDAIVLQSVRDGSPTTELVEQKWFEAHGFHFVPERYFCAGLSFYNLKLFREEKIGVKVCDFLKTYRDVRFADQTAMNVLLADRTRMLDLKWQRFSHVITDSDIKQGCAIHYAGDFPIVKRGWRINAISDIHMMWFWVYAWSNKITIWKAVSALYPGNACEIIFRRFLSCCVTNVVLRLFFFSFLILVRRQYHIPLFKVWCRKIDWHKVKGHFGSINR